MGRKQRSVVDIQGRTEGWLYIEEKRFRGRGGINTESRYRHGQESAGRSNVMNTSRPTDEKETCAGAKIKNKKG